MDAAHTSDLMAATPQLDLLLLFGTGLAISLGHCLGMCGPLVGSLAAAQRSRGLKIRGQALAQLLHHAGRLTSYALIGLVLAGAGATARATAQGRHLQGGLTLVVGVAMALVALGLLGLLPTQRWIEGRGLTRLVVRASAGLRSIGGPGGRFLLGLANGLLPCGPVYAVALGAIAASPRDGAAAMIAFGLGTVPALLAFALGAARLGPTLQHRFHRLGSVLVLILGVQIALRGAAALGWIGHLRWGKLMIW